MLTRPWDTISFCRSLDFSSNTLIAWNSQHAQNPGYKHAQHCPSESPWRTTITPSACVNWFLFACIFMYSKNPQDHPQNLWPRWVVSGQGFTNVVRKKGLNRVVVSDQGFPYMVLEKGLNRGSSPVRLPTVLESGLLQQHHRAGYYRTATTWKSLTWC